MKKKYTKRQIFESIKYWQKQLRAGNYKKLNESFGNSLVLGFRIQDYGGTVEEHLDLNNLDNVSTTGLKWIQKQLENWEDGYIQNNPEDYYAEFKREFDNVKNTSFLMKVLSKLVADFESSGEEYAEYDLGGIADSDNVYVFLTYNA